MEKVFKGSLFLLAFIISVLTAPEKCYGEETEPGLSPVYGKDIKDGSYQVEVESSSSMFRVVKAELTVEKESIKADITLSGTGYLKLFMGKGQEALKAGEDSYIPYEEDESGAYTYTIPIEALNAKFPCAAYSKRKETWYDRQLVIWSSSLPKEAFTGEAQEMAKPAPVLIEKDTGEYTAEVSLKGGTGRAGIVSPAHIHVEDGSVSALIQWNSPNFDYMIVNGQKYLPVNSGNGEYSVFEIPVLAWDAEMNVTADTVAMNSPHEIEYILIFHSDTLQKEKSGSRGLAAAVISAAAVGAGWLIIYRGRRKARNA